MCVGRVLSANECPFIPDGDEDAQHLRLAKMRTLVFRRATTAGGKTTQRSKIKLSDFLKIEISKHSSCLESQIPYAYFQKK